MPTLLRLRIFPFKAQPLALARSFDLRCWSGVPAFWLTIAPMTSSTTPSLAQDARTIGLVGLAHAVSHFGHLLLAVMFPVFIVEFSLSYSQLGLLTSVFFCRFRRRAGQCRFCGR